MDPLIGIKVEPVEPMSPNVEQCQGIKEQGSSWDELKPPSQPPQPQPPPLPFRGPVITGVGAIQLTNNGKDHAFETMFCGDNLDLIFYLDNFHPHASTASLRPSTNSTTHSIRNLTIGSIDNIPHHPVHGYPANKLDQVVWVGRNITYSLRFKNDLENQSACGFWHDLITRLKNGPRVQYT